MLKNITKYLLILVLSTLLFFLVYVAFNAEFRRSVMTYVIGGYKSYQIISIKSALNKNRINDASKKLLNFIRISELLSSGKNNFLLVIYDGAKLVESKASTEDEYLLLDQVFQKLIEIDPNLYQAQIWLAKTSIIKKQEDKALDYINKAIAISPSQAGAYRLALALSQKTKDKYLFNYYCNKYKNSKLGGNKPRYVDSFFGGNVITKFALEFLPKKAKPKYYVNSGIILNEFEDYEFFPDGTLTVNGIKIYINFLAGMKIEIKDIQLIHNNNEISTVSLTKSFAGSESAFLDNSNKELITYLILNENDEVLNIDFLEEFKNINKIILRIKFSKLDLSNESKCDLNEKTN